MSNINILGLGGLQEIGKNLYVVEVDEKIFILDCGLKYPTSELYGVDIIIPDAYYLYENKDRVEGIFLTHAHDDHIGSISYLLEKIDTKVYASKFTLAIVKDILNTSKYNIDEEKLIEVTDDSSIVFGNVTVEFFETAHNIPGSLGIVLKTEDGNIIYTGNYTFDQNVKIDFKKIYYKLATYANEGVLALLQESQGANNEDSRGNLLEFKQRINSIFQTSKSRIIFSLFSNDLQKMQQIVDLALVFNKRIAILGRKTQKIVNQGINLGYLKVPMEKLINLKFIDEHNKNDEDDLVVLVCGERHEPYFMLQRMSKKIDRLIKLKESDTIVILTVPMLGTEKMAARTLDMVYKVTSNVKLFKSNLLPAPNASREEIKALINILQPLYLIPVCGEFRHQFDFINIAKCIGYDDNSVVILDNGDKVNFIDKEYTGISPESFAGEIMIDGRAVGDVGDVVMRDRELLAGDGALLIVANINPKTKKVVAGPEIVCKGFVYLQENEEIVKSINEIFNKVTQKHSLSKYIVWNEYKNDIKNEVSRLLYRQTKRNPIVIPVVISTDI